MVTWQVGEDDYEVLHTYNRFSTSTTWNSGERWSLLRWSISLLVPHERHKKQTNNRQEYAVGWCFFLSMLFGKTWRLYGSYMVSILNNGQQQWVSVLKTWRWYWGGMIWRNGLPNLNMSSEMLLGFWAMHTLFRHKLAHKCSWYKIDTIWFCNCIITLEPICFGHCVKTGTELSADLLVVNWSRYTGHHLDSSGKPIRTFQVAWEHLAVTLVREEFNSHFWKDFSLYGEMSLGSMSLNGPCPFPQL